MFNKKDILKNCIDKLRIDSQKLIYHIPRVYDWYCGKNIYPIYLEIGISGACNQQCIFCAFDYLKNKSDIVSIKSAKKLISDVAACGIKSILYSGEGEPLLNKDAGGIIAFTKKKGIDVALSTNGVLFTQDMAKDILPYLTWLRVSLDSASSKSYKLLHGTEARDFDIVINNLKSAVKIRNRLKNKCTINVQFLLMPKNYNDVLHLAPLLEDIGVDCLIVKPYSLHPLSKNNIPIKFEQYALIRLEEKLVNSSKGNLKIIFRNKAMQNLKQGKPYKKCLGLSFAAHISSGGDMYPCNAFIGNDKFLFGNVYKNSFKNIWNSAKRRKVINFLSTRSIVKNCRNACRLDEINRYLWELKNPHPHVNFI